jgi:hypothetical protein
MFGTYRTYRATLTMSDDRGKTDLALGYLEVPVLPKGDIL